MSKSLLPELLEDLEKYLDLRAQAWLGQVGERVPTLPSTADGKVNVRAITATHALRHFLNNLAQEGMLSQLDIARWSGRKDIRENAAYDHTGGRHTVERMREVAKTDAMLGPLRDTIVALPPVDRDSFNPGS